MEFYHLKTGIFKKKDCREARYCVSTTLLKNKEGARQEWTIEGDGILPVIS